MAGQGILSISGDSGLAVSPGTLLSGSSKLKATNLGESTSPSLSCIVSPSPVASNGHQQAKPRSSDSVVARALFPTLSGTGTLTDILGLRPVTSTVKVQATVALVKKSVLDVQDKTSEAIDAAADLLGQNVEFQLVSVDLDPDTGKPKVSDATSIHHWVLADLSINDITLAIEESSYTITFKLPTDFGLPGAILVKNDHPNEFFLRSLTLQSADGNVIFPCNSTIYNSSRYPDSDGYRLFFSNKSYLPGETPAGLEALREQELQIKRGNGKGERQPWERIYDYAVYNDLSHPDLLTSTIRPILGGSTSYPYPRRIRTGRPPSRAAPEFESNLSSLLLEIFYIPRDEMFSREKTSSFLGDAIKSVGNAIIPAVSNFLDTTPRDFDTFQDIKALYDEGVDLTGQFNADVQEGPTWTNPFTLIDRIFNSDGNNASLLRFPVPDVIKADEKAWFSDDEFGRQPLSGINPLVIERIREYPPKSSLDPNLYGPGTALTNEHIQPYLEGLTVDQAIQAKRLFKIDYHDIFLPYINKQNTDGNGQGYAPRSIFFLTNQGTLRPIAIELALEKSIRVFTAPKEDAKEKDYLWELAKLHANTVDFGYHELISHWLQTHAVMEPVIIATNRQLSDLHPIFILLRPHFRNTMNINAAARQALINSYGIIETTFTPGKYCMEMTSVVYGALWRFDRQALPEDLIARGMAEPADDTQPGRVKLVIEDYPFAKDGLELWDAIKSWVAKYVHLAYKGSDAAVKADTELQAWWKELVEVGHGDLKTASWWPKLDSLNNLTHTLTTIIWTAGPHHAAVNSGQYGYGGYMPNRPSMTRRLVPEVGSPEYQELLSNPEKYLLRSISSTLATISVMATIEILSTHAADEEYLGQRQDPNWTSDPALLDAFQDFGNKIDAVGKNIIARNSDPKLLNRLGTAKVPYTLLYPTSTDGLTGQGVPNSTSI